MSALLVLLLAAAAPAPVSVSATPAKTEVTVGEPFGVELAASGPAGTTYTFPAATGDDQVELRLLPAPASPAPAPGRASYQAAVFALENPQLPPVTVRYRLADGSEGEARSAPVPLKVGTLLPKDPKEQSPADIRGPLSLEVGRAFWVGAALAVLALAGLLAWLVRRRRRAAPAAAPAADDTVFVHPANLPAPGEPVRANGFTSEPLGWKAWLPVLDVAQASEHQLAVLKASHPTATSSDYYLTLGWQPRILEERSAAFNAIMYAPGGLSRAERELASTVVSRVNGCVYCAAVHALRFEQLARRNDVIVQVFEDPERAGTQARERAIVRASIALTRGPGTFDASALREVRAAGLDALEIIDLVHAIAIFAWANRLMLNLGEPVFP